MICGRCGTRRVFHFRVDTSHPDYLRELAETERELLHEEPAESPPAPPVLPPGHKVELFALRESLDPWGSGLQGGVCVAFLGQGSDKPEDDLEYLLSHLKQWTGDPQRPVLISQEEGPLSQLFAPSQPPIIHIPRFLIWVFGGVAPEGWLEDPARLQALLRRLYRLEHSAQPVTQWVYFEHDTGQGALVLARLLAGLGLNVRVRGPDPHRILLAEVHRPEGVVITRLVGHPFPLEGTVDDFLATVNAEKDRAEAQGDAPRLQDLEQRERDYLAREIEPIQVQLHRMALPRAPHLIRLLRTFVEQRSPTARRALDEELLGRTLPLVLLLGPDGQSVFLADFPGNEQAVRVFPDLRFARMAAKDLKLAEGSYRIGCGSARDIFSIAAEGSHSVALNVYLTPEQPVYVFWSPEDARRMAQGQLPSVAPLVPASSPSRLRPLPTVSDAFVAAQWAIPGAGDKLTPEQLNTLLTETDIYVEHGLYERAIEHLEWIFFVDPENPGAHEKVFSIRELLLVREDQQHLLARLEKLYPLVSLPDEPLDTATRARD
jgi:hypothetical protein